MVTVCVLLYRLICGVGCCGLFVYYLGPCVPKFMSVGLLFMGGACYGYDDFFGMGLVCI